jgi:ABC-type dipeptide/oligopeptide/nickel transport system permease subunit
MLQTSKPKNLKMVVFLVICFMEIMVGSLASRLSFLGVYVVPSVAQWGHVFAPPLQLFVGP